MNQKILIKILDIVLLNSQMKGDSKGRKNLMIMMMIIMNTIREFGKLLHLKRFKEILLNNKNHYPLDWQINSHSEVLLVQIKLLRVVYNLNFSKKDTISQFKSTLNAYQFYQTSQFQIIPNVYKIHCQKINLKLTINRKIHLFLLRFLENKGKKTDLKFINFFQDLMQSLNPHQ